VSATGLKFAIYDVFTGTPFAGNPLAVVFDADALADERMQVIAREFNLSETIFVRAPANADHAASVRIFTPTKELPFAGHPTVGCAIALAEQRGKRNDNEDVALVLETGIGPVPCTVARGDGSASRAEFTAPRLAAQVGPDPSPGIAATVLGLRTDDIGFGAHKPSLFGVGVAFAMVPVANVKVLGRARAALEAPPSLLGATEVYVYTRAPSNSAHAFRARMFAPEIGIVEDPATGGGAAAFAGVLARFETLTDGWHTRRILQGVEMGRPSLIHLDVLMKGRALAGARIAGQAVKISEGVLYA
jgi:trans-2,3-dihydro-3-hydroxyanthranilate isomerase